MVNDNTPTRQRIRIQFGKLGALRYTGHLDVAKLWERVLRRADLPILYSQGFNTRARIQIASALPLGITSECEYVEVSLRERIELDGLVPRLRAVSPDGLAIYALHEVSIHSPAAQTLVRSAIYCFRFEDGVDPDLLRARAADIMARDQIIQITERKGRKQAANLRPLFYDLQVDEAGDLIAHVAAGEHGNLRPEEVMRELGFEGAFVSVHRRQLMLEESR